MLKLFKSLGDKAWALSQPLILFEVGACAISIAQCAALSGDAGGRAASINIRHAFATP